MAQKRYERYQYASPREFFPEEGQQDAIPWAKGARASDDIGILSTRFKSLSFVSAAMNNTGTTVVADPNYQAVSNSAVFIRQEYQAHLFFDSLWIIKAVAGNPGPTASLTINLQTWFNQYHLLISPNGFANDWTVTLPPISANATTEFTQTFMGGFFNVELRKQPNSHIMEFFYQVTSIPTGWATITIKPRMTMVYAMPILTSSFVTV